MKPVFKHVDQLVKNVFNKQHPILGEVILNWGGIVGTKFSLKSSPLKITSLRSKGKKLNILHIAAENSSVSMEMSYQQDIIIERIAVYFGYKAIEKIKFTVRG